MEPANPLSELIKQQRANRKDRKYLSPKEFKKFRREYKMRPDVQEEVRLNRELVKRLEKARTFKRF